MVHLGGVSGEPYDQSTSRHSPMWSTGTETRVSAGVGEGETTESSVSLPEVCRPGPRDGGGADVGFSVVSSLFYLSFQYHLHRVECMGQKSVAS